MDYNSSVTEARKSVRVGDLLKVTDCVEEVEVAIVMSSIVGVISMLDF